VQDPGVTWGTDSKTLQDVVNWAFFGSFCGCTYSCQPSCTTP